MKPEIGIMGIALCLAVGCYQQSYEETRVWSSSNAPAKSPGWIVVDPSSRGDGTISIKAEGVRVDHLLIRLSEHEGVDLEFAASNRYMLCTVNLEHVPLMSALESIAGIGELRVIPHGGGLVVVDDNGEPNNQIEDMAPPAPTDGSYVESW